MTSRDHRSKTRRPDWVPVAVVSMVSVYFVFAVFIVLWLAEPRTYSAQEISDALSETGVTCSVVTVSEEPARSIVDCYDEDLDRRTHPQTPSIAVVQMLDAELQAMVALDPCLMARDVPLSPLLWEDGQNWIGVVLDRRWTNDVGRVLGGEVVTCPPGGPPTI